MIKINLLPTELRKQDIAKNVNINNYLIFPVVLMVLVLVSNLLLGFVIVCKKIRLEAAEGQWKNFYPSYKPVEQVQGEIVKAEEKWVFLKDIIGQNISWSPKLNILSDNLSNGMWFERIETKPDGSIYIDGSIVSSLEDEVSILNKFIANLKKNQEFFKDFKEVKIRSLNNRAVQNQEIKDFVLDFYPRQDEGN
jgi:hypothetical protein